MKIIGTILLDPNDKYICNGKLPERGYWDKKLLQTVIKHQIVSKEGYEMLPPSLQKDVFLSPAEEPEAPITIEEINGLADILVVSRSSEICTEGRTFRFNNFELIVSGKEIEIWKRKDNV